MSLLEIKELSKSFGGVQATHDVTLSVREHDLLGLIGPNGAGKTTLLKLITGTLKPDKGQILLGGVDITALPGHRRARAGIIMTHQIVRPFRGMTLKGNVVAATPSGLFDKPLAAMLTRPKTASDERAFGLLERLGIADAAEHKAGQVPLGYLKRLQIARALAAEPRILLLDEPLAGLNHAEARKIADLIRQLHEERLTIVLIEHNLNEVLRISERLAVLDNGRLLAEGDPQETIRRADVRAAYLGTKAEAG